MSLTEDQLHPSAIVMIRHGESFYTNTLPDLTPKGVEQISDCAHFLKQTIVSYKQIFCVSSPAARAVGSAQLFLSALDLPITPIKISPSIRPFDIYDLEGFLDYDRRRRTEKYGEVWLSDLYLYRDNSLVESRIRVNHRAQKFFQQYSRFLTNKAREQSSCLLAFSHFEILANLMQALYPGEAVFPIHREAAPQNGEAVIFKLHNPVLNIHTAIGRGREVLVRHHPGPRRFIHLASPI